MESRLLLSGTAPSPLSVTAVSPPDGAQATLPLSQIDVTFSEPVAPASVSPANLLVDAGTVISAEQLSGDTVRYQLAGITSEETVHLSIPDGALADAQGNPSQAFSSSFTTDIGTIPFPGQMSSVQLSFELADPLASMGSTTGSIGVSGDTDAFTFVLGAGQLLSLSVAGAASLQPSIELHGPDGSMISTVTGAAGSAAVLPPYTVSAPGTYTAIASGANQTTGAYTVTAMLDAVPETETLTGARNDMPASAQDLNASFTPLGGGAGLATVLGTADGYGPTDAKDHYSFDLAAGQSASLGLHLLLGPNDIPPQGNHAGVQLFDEDGNLLAIADFPASSGNLDYPLNDFVATHTGRYDAVVSAPAGMNYALAVARDVEIGAVANYAGLTTPLQSAAENGVRRAVGNIPVPGDYEMYPVSLQAGDVLRAWTTTPPEGIGATANAFDPILIVTLNNTTVASDDNSAPDHRNAELTYTAASSGTYSVTVSAAYGTYAGHDYVLSVQGGMAAAKPLQLEYPTQNAVIGDPSPNFLVRFDQPVLVSSITPSSLTVDGIPATGFNMLTADEVSFTLPAQLAEGSHTWALAAGAVTTPAGMPSAAFSGQFIVDTTPPRVVGSSIHEGQTVPAGSLTYMVQFSEPMPSYIASATDLVLTGSAGAIAPASLALDSTGTVLTATYANLPEDSYTLKLVAANIRDAAGNQLDGEPHFPMPPNVSGDGTPGGDFLVHFTADRTTLSLDGLLQTLGPSVSGAAGVTLPGSIGTPDDTDTFMLEMAAGDTLSLNVLPSSTLQPAITVSGPSGNALQTRSAAAPGGDVQTDQITAPTAGTYTIVLSGASGTGGYTFAARVGATPEAESAGGPDNNSRSAAQDLSPLLRDIGSGAQRATILGTTDGGGLPPTSEVEPNDTIATANLETDGFAGPSQHAHQLSISGSGNVFSTNTYYLGLLHTGDVISARGSVPKSGTFQPGIEVDLFRGTASGLLVARTTSAGAVVVFPATPLAITDNYYLSVRVISGSASFSLSVLLVDNGAAPAAGSAPSNTPAPAWTNVPYWAQITGSLTPQDLDLFAYQFHAGDLVELSARPHQLSASAGIDLLDSSGHVLASGVSLPTGAFVGAFSVASTGTYYARVREAMSLQTVAYTLDAYVSGTNPKAGIPAPTPDWYSVSLAGGQSLSVAMSFPTDLSVQLTLTDAAGNVLGRAAGGASNSQAFFNGFVASGSGVYFVQVTGDSATPYTLAVARGASLQSTPNNSVASAQPLGADGTVIGNLAAGTVDEYRVWAVAGAPMVIATATPQGAANPAPPDLSLTVTGATNLLLAQDDNSAPDGRNARLNFVAPATGWYTIAVSGEGSGDYVLTATPAARIQGAIFNDSNLSGSQDPTELGVGGWTVYIDDNRNGHLDPGELRTTTDAAGQFTFDALPPGEYVIRQTPRDGWRQITRPGAVTASLSAGQNLALAPFADVQVSAIPMDFSYLLRLAQHYGGPGNFASGDVNDDGKVDFADLLLVAQNYGHPLSLTTAGPILSPAAIYSSPWLGRVRTRKVLPTR